jgi:hypothetical protein
MYVIIPTKDIFLKRLVSKRDVTFVPVNEEAMKYKDSILDFVVELSVSTPYEIPRNLLLSYFLERYYDWTDFNPMLLEKHLFNEFFDIVHKLYKRFNENLNLIKIDEVNFFNPSSHIVSSPTIVCYDVAIQIEPKLNRK